MGPAATGPDRWSGPVRDLAVLAVVLGGLWATTSPGAGRAVQAGTALVVAVAVLLRHRLPVPAAATATGATVLAWVLGATADPGVLVGVCLFTVAERHWRRAVPPAVLAATALTGLALLTVSPAGTEEGLRASTVAVVVVAASWALGVRTRQVRDGAAARAVAEQRLALAREVHDVLSHSLGTIGVRAGVAAHVPGTGAEELRDLLREIEQDARGSLDELREVLDDLRAPGGTAPAEELERLARVLRRCGVDTEVTVTVPGPLPPPVRAALQRIAQEATTNVARHSGATRCRITLSAAPGGDGVVLRVADDGTGAHAVEGHGATGMRERAAALGGTVRIDTGGGTTVTAHLPAVVGEPA